MDGPGAAAYPNGCKAAFGYPTVKSPGSNRDVAAGIGPDIGSGRFRSKGGTEAVDRGVLVDPPGAAGVSSTAQAAHMSKS